MGLAESLMIKIVTQVSYFPQIILFIYYQLYYIFRVVLFHILSISFRNFSAKLVGLQTLHIHKSNSSCLKYSMSFNVVVWWQSYVVNVFKTRVEILTGFYFIWYLKSVPLMSVNWCKKDCHPVSIACNGFLIWSEDILVYTYINVFDWNLGLCLKAEENASYHLLICWMI